jgi:ribosomal protein L7Ae-like RNA K-turn-binding protein
MSVHVRFETPEDVETAVYALVQEASKVGAIKKGSNEVTKAAERGNAKIIIMAEDVNPPELLAHIPMICDEKNIPYAYVREQEFLAKECGMPNNVKTASIAVMEVGKGAQSKFDDVISHLANIKGE